MNLTKKTPATLIALTILYLHGSTLHADEPGWCRKTWSWLTSCCSKERRTNYKSQCRDCVERWFDESRRPEYGINVLDELKDETKLVVFIHGLNSRPEDMQAVITEAQEAGLPCATFRFPNDQSINESTEILSNELADLHQRFPKIRVSIVAHSLGCLVSRNLIETPSYAAWHVDRLIMLAPPNHGSPLAKYACSLDLWEYATSKRRRDEANLIVGSFADGLSEATDDLEPDSKFLQRLNKKSRNASVNYTIVIGTKGAVTSKVSYARLGLRKVGEKSSWIKRATDHIDGKVDKHEELVDGKGDGIVSVKSAELEGVDDVIYGRFSHGEVLSSDPSRQLKEIRASIVQRLMSSD